MRDGNDEKALEPRPLYKLAYARRERVLSNVRGGERPTRGLQRVAYGRALAHLRPVRYRLNPFGAPLAVVVLVLAVGEEHGAAAVNVQDFADALDDGANLLARLVSALQREQEPVDDGLALGLRLYGREEARVDDGLGGLRGEYFEQSKLALREAARAVRNVYEAYQLALYLQRHAQDIAYAPALCEVRVETCVRHRLVGDEGRACLVDGRVRALALKSEVEL